MFPSHDRVGRRIGLADFAFLFGGYVQDTTSFKERRIKPYGVDVTDSLGFVPVAGVEMSMKQELTNKLDLRFNMAYTVAILQLNLSLVYEIGD